MALLLGPQDLHQREGRGSLPQQEVRHEQHREEGVQAGVHVHELDVPQVPLNPPEGQHPAETTAGQQRGEHEPAHEHARKYLRTQPVAPYRQREDARQPQRVEGCLRRTARQRRDPAPHQPLRVEEYGAVRLGSERVVKEELALAGLPHVREVGVTVPVEDEHAVKAARVARGPAEDVGYRGQCGQQQRHQQHEAPFGHRWCHSIGEKVHILFLLMTIADEARRCRQCRDLDREGNRPGRPGLSKGFHG